MSRRLDRRGFLAATSLAAWQAVRPARGQEPAGGKARIAITLDLEMSRHYPQRGMMEWDFKKGDLDEATKRYSVEAARVAREHGGLIHFFCVGRVLEQPDVEWLQEIAAAGHPIGNHTYDHVNVHATTLDSLQFRFARAPWLANGKPIPELIEQNIRITTEALQQRAGIQADGFRTPGGFTRGLAGREDLQKMLLGLGFRWVSSLYPAHRYGTPKQEPTADVYDSIVAAQADAQPFAYPSGLVEVPMSPISDVGAFRSTWWKLEWFLEATRRAVRHAIETGGAFDFLAHPSCLVVEDPQFETIKLICELVKEAGPRAEIVSLGEIAASVSPPPPP